MDPDAAEVIGASRPDAKTGYRPKRKPKPFFLVRADQA
jgi:hypothetical protein